MSDSLATSVLVLGIGNTLLSDEGVGVRAMQSLQQRLAAREDVEFLDGGTLSFTLAPAIAEHDSLIVIDAAELGVAPGGVAVFADEEMDGFLGTNRKRSVHEVSLLDLMAVTLLEDQLPRRRALIAIQPERVDWGDDLSEPVAASIPEVCSRAETLIASWQT